ncbi:MAG: hypothetical protein U0073_11540, partial [Bacteroidia bacterium]
MQPGNYYLGYIVNRNHEILEGGDTIAAEGWYQEMIILPDPSNRDRFYLFHAGITTSYPGLYYTIIDLSYNGGLGKVVQKNIQLHNFPVSDGLAAVKHGNGRDWWIFFRRWDYSNTVYYEYLLTPTGLSGPYVQNIGSTIKSGTTRIKFTKDGKRMIAVDPGNMIEVYDIDRCTGVLSNANIIHPHDSVPPYTNYWSHAVSENGRYLYITSIYNGSNHDTSYLFQFDLQASNVLNSIDTLQTFVRPVVAGLLQRGPDDKIYLSCSMEFNDCEFFYLYCDTSYYPENMNIGVINQPNNAGAACDFQPFSFYLGGHRTYVGLPNNPDYELGADTTSLCDTLVNVVNPLQQQNTPAELHVFYHGGWEKIFLNAYPVQGKKYTLRLLDINGKIIYQENGATDAPYFSKSLSTHSLPRGIYLVVFETEKEKLVGRFLN